MPPSTQGCNGAKMDPMGLGRSGPLYLCFLTPCNTSWQQCVLLDLWRLSERRFQEIVFVS